MHGLVKPIEELTRENTDFRRVLYTASHTQLVLMCLQPGEEIGAEVHAENDQFLRIESGSGYAEINGVQYPIRDGDAVLVPAGARHNIVNSSEVQMHLYTLYSPPHHLDGVRFATKAEAEASDEEFEGTTTEQ